MFCSISYTKDSLWALTNDVWSASRTLHDRRYLAGSVPATRDAQQISLISSFCVQAMSFGGQICVTIHLYLFSIWARQHCFVKRHFFLKFSRPSRISQFAEERNILFCCFPNQFLFKLLFTQLYFLIGGLCACCILLTALLLKKHTTPKGLSSLPGVN